MFNLPKNKPEDVEFIKRAHQDPNWPEDLDKPIDWDTVPLWSKIWFVVEAPVKGICWVIAFCTIGIAIIEFIDAGESLDEPYCHPSPQGCYE